MIFSLSVVCGFSHPFESLPVIATHCLFVIISFMCSADGCLDVFESDECESTEENGIETMPLLAIEPAITPVQE